ncbi:MAG: hypothetical protein ACFCVB_21130 [Nodosilinea sp.]
MAASSLWTVAQAYPAQPEGLETPILIQVDDTQIGDTQIDDTQDDEPTATESLSDESLNETAAEIMPIVSAEDVADTVAVDALVADVTPVPTEVLENLSQEQMDAIASIILTAEASTSPGLIANLPTEVLTQLDALGVEQQVGRRRWLPNGLVRRLRLPQVVASLIRQPRNTALGMLGNHIVVINPVTGAILGAVLSAL